MARNPEAQDNLTPISTLGSSSPTRREFEKTVSTKDRVTQSLGFTGDLVRLSGVRPIGASIGPYQLVREIGRGGYGIVYLAEDTRLGRQVAIKVARPEMVADAEGIARFRREATTAATLDHPGVIAVFDCGDVDGIYFYVMPFLDCPNLAQWFELVEKPLSEALVARLIIDLAEAIQYGHLQGIIHRDLKPQNILLKPDPNHPNGFRPVVLDFGLCGLVNHENSTTSMLAGTPRYMSPEQAMFGLSRVNHRSDIYSIGVILYQLLVGQPPHQAQSIAEAVLMLHSQPVEPPSRLRASLSSDLETICLKCLRKDQDCRYESAQQLVADLQGYLHGKPIAARREGLHEKLLYAVRHGAAELSLGVMVITINLTIFSWSAVSSLIVGRDFTEMLWMSREFAELLIFLMCIALPTHLISIYFGWLMTQKTPYYRRLTIGLLFSAAWLVPLWRSVINNRSFLSFYEGRELTQSVVFLLIAGGFTVQTACLAIGVWCARQRAKLSDAGNEPTEI